jgi:hypothetical protein
LQDRNSDMSINADGELGAQGILGTVVLPVGIHLVQAHYVVELQPLPPTTQAKLVTVYFEPITLGDPNIVMTGQRASTVSVHQALPVAQIDVGPCRFDNNGTTSNNIVARIRMDDPPQGGGPATVIIKARTPGASDKAGAGTLVAT